eukprot:12021462-Ditylum_brightwellii.AAC.1
MGCSLGSGSLGPLSSSIGITWGLLCLPTLGDGGVIICLLGCTLRSGETFSNGADWGGLLIILGGGTFTLGCVAFLKILANCQIACNCSSHSAAKSALV